MPKRDGRPAEYRWRPQSCILNLYLGHTMCRSMVDIQSATAEIRQGIKKKKINRYIEKTTGQKYNGLPYYIGRP